MELEVNRGYKFRVNKISEEAKQFHHLNAHSARFVWNELLDSTMAWQEEYDEFYWPKYKDIRDENEWLKDCDSWMANFVEKAYKRAWQECFKGTRNQPKFKKRGKTRLAYTTMGRDVRIFNTSWVKLPKMEPIKIKLHRALPNNYKITQATLIKTPSGKYELSLNIKYIINSNEQVIDLDKAIGLDYSSPSLFIDSQGEKAPGFIPYYRKLEDKLAKAQHLLDNMEYKSKNYFKQLEKVNKIHEKIKNSRRNYLHNLSRMLVNTYDIICVEG